MDDAIRNFIKEHPTFTTSEFTDMIRVETPDIGRSTIFHILKTLCESGELSKLGRGIYASSSCKNYSYELSTTATNISSMITSEYPLIDFQIWELYQMNEFVNHLMAKNTIFVDVENMQDETVFNLLFEKYPHVLHLPSIDDYYKYSGDETVIIQRLISESPPHYGEHKQAPLEKILVDLFSHGIIGRIVSRSEYRAIYEDSFQKYNINHPKLFRYARRRGVEQEIKQFIKAETNVSLEDIK